MLMIEKEIEENPLHYFITEPRYKETIVFLHAAFADHSQFDEQIAYFSSAYTVIAVDLLGHGKSEKAPKDDTITNTSKYLANMLLTEGIEKAHFVGISLGALIVQDFANNFPTLVASLSCFGGYDINNFDSEKQRKNSKSLTLLKFKSFFSAKWFAKSNSLVCALTEEAQEKIFYMNLRFKKGCFRFINDYAKLGTNKKNIYRDYPLLIGCGDNDIPIAAETTKEWGSYEKNCSFIIFANTGHLVNMDTPNEFNRVLYDFIA